MNKVINAISLFENYYKDKVNSEQLNLLDKEYYHLLSTDAELRRKKKKEIILNMVDLRIELAKFKITYDSVKSKYGSIDTVDRVIKELEYKIREYSFLKNKRSF